MTTEPEVLRLDRGILAKPGVLDCGQDDRPAPQEQACEHDDREAPFQDLQRRHIDLVGRYSWALAVATELAQTPRGPLGLLAQCLPHGLWRWFQTRQLRRKQLFDLQAYRRRYPDTKRSKIGPLAHFLRRGVIEGRSGGPNRAPGPASEAPAEVVDAVLRSGLFDFDWYCARYGLAAESPEAAVRHYLAESLADPLHCPGPLFSGAFYILENPDTARINPLQHYLGSGVAEGRRAFSPLAVNTFMEGAASQALNRIEELLDPARPTVVLYWQRGNFFFEDIATYVAEYLARRGYVARCAFDDAGVDSDQHNFVVVAPHEYCVHGPGKAWSARQAGGAVYVNTEQWHTSWFSLALGAMARSGKVLDINPASARGLRRLGMQAAFLPIVPGEGATFTFPRAPLSPQTAALRGIKPLTYPEQLADRPYDILYVAVLNERRAEILAKLAPTLARHDCFLHTPLLKGPVTPHSANMIPSADLAQLARNSKILLNIHQGESHYFEWHRLFVSGIVEGCVVVTEPCIGTGMLTAGIHYLEVEAGSMGQYLDWLLHSAEGRQTMAMVRHNCAMFRDGPVDIKALLP